MIRNSQRQLVACDVHSHVYFSDYDSNREEVLARMKEERIGTIAVGVDFDSSQKAVQFANAHDNIYASVGLHPNNTEYALFSEEQFSSLMSDAKVVAVGECGLDYFRLEGSDEDIEQHKIRQKAEFEKQIEFAVRYDKPMMLHCRPTKNSMDGYRDALDMLEAKQKEHGDAVRGNFHFFVGNREISEAVFDLGFTVSFPGIITFADEYHDVVKHAPLDMIHAETDAPYASPLPHRGKTNEPAYVLYTIAKIAELKRKPVEEVQSALLANAKRVFGVQ